EFSLFTDRVRRQVLRHRSTFPFVRSDLGYVGFKRVGLPYRREPRRFGKTHYNLFRMTKFAVAGILSASTFPLRAIVYAGLPLAPIALLAIVPYAAIGWPSLGFLALLNLAFIATALAFLATYLARVYKDVVGRPLFIVDRELSAVNDDIVLE